MIVLRRSSLSSTRTDSKGSGQYFRKPMGSTLERPWAVLSKAHGQYVGKAMGSRFERPMAAHRNLRYRAFPQRLCLTPNNRALPPSMPCPRRLCFAPDHALPPTTVSALPFTTVPCLQFARTKSLKILSHSNVLPMDFRTYRPWPFEHTVHSLSRIRIYPPTPKKVEFSPNGFFDVLGVAKRRRRLEF